MRRIFPIAAALALSSFGVAIAAPIAITACTTITQPGSYVLANNISTGGNCIVVSASFVTIDLNGFMMNGNTKGGSAILEQPGSALRAITVRNGAITAFAQAVFFPKSAGVVVERITAVGNTGTAITAGDMATVRDSATHENGGSGIQLGLFSLVKGNASSENSGLGIFVSTGAQIVDNDVAHNGGVGINAGEGANVVHNVSRNNGTDGIFVQCPSAVVSNAATNNLGTNIVLLGGACVSDHNSDL
jgi:Right handed beta helix region